MQTLTITDLIIQAVCANPNHIKVSRIASQTGVSRQKVSRYLKAMADLEWLTATEKGSYELGQKLPDLLTEARARLKQEGKRLQGI